MPHPTSNPQDIRCRFAPEVNSWIIEGVAVKMRKGKTDSQDIAAIQGEGEEQWTERGRFATLSLAVRELQQYTDVLGVHVRSFDTTPLDPQNAQVIAARAALQQLVL